MDVFTLVGKISIDIQSALSNIESVIGKVQELEGLLNGTQTTTQTTTQQTGAAVEKATEDATTKTGNALSKWSIMMGNLATQAANKVYNAGKSFFQIGFEYNQNMEKWTASFKTYMGGDMEKATAFMEEIRQFAVDTPLSLTDTVNSAVRLFATGFEQENIIDSLSMLGDIANGDTEKMKRLALVYSQVKAADKLQGNDVLQFKDAGVPIHQLVADYYNTLSSEELLKRGWLQSPGSFEVGDVLGIQKDGHLWFEDVHEALMLATSEGGMYYNAMNNIMDTEYGQAQKMMDTYEQAAGAFTNAIFEIFKSDTIPALNEILQQLNEWATENPDALKNLGEAFSDFATGGLELLLTSLQTLLGWWNENRAAFDSMLVLLGGIAIYAGHPAAGTALIATGAVDAYADAKKQIEAGSPVGQEILRDPEIAEALKTGTTDELGFVDWVSYNIGAPLVQFLHNLFPGLVVEPDDPSVYGLPAGNGGFSTRDDIAPSAGADGTSGSNSNNPFIASMQAAAAQIRSEVSAGAQEGVAAGLSGVTVTGTVTTGNVMLDGGVIVGQLAPKFNLVLGGMNAISGRG